MPRNPWQKRYPEEDYLYDLDVIAEQIDPGFSALRQAAEMFKDHQAGRIAQAGRIRSLTINVTDGYAEYAASMESMEAYLSKRLVAIYREVVPLGVQDWAKQTTGIGKTSPHMLARLMGHLGHPRLAIPKYWVSQGENGAGPRRELMVGDAYLRSVGQLWQFCGHGSPKRLRKDMPQEEILAMGSPVLKSVVHLLAENVVKAQVRKGEAIGELGAVYLATKERYRSRGHNGPCPGGHSMVAGKVVRVRCKVDGRYADEGDPFQDSHLHAIALRKLGKEILRDLWVAAEEPWSPESAYELAA